jgi:uncharacterized repeat protein (TIGR02543 family)
MRPKRLISLLVAVCMMITMLPLSAVTAFAEDTSSSTKYGTAIVDGYRYGYMVNADGKTVTIEGFSALDNSPFFYGDIPEKLDGYTVTAIGNDAFYYCLPLKEVTIPQSVTSIGERAFANCSNLNSLTIKDAATSIGAYAFIGCTSLTTLSLGKKITAIGNRAFYHCMELESVTIPENVTTIRPGTFDYCTHLESITLPAGLTSFQDNLTGCPADCVIYFNNDEATALDRFGSNTELAGHKLLCLLGHVTFDANGGTLTDKDGNLTNHAKVPVYKTEKITKDEVDKLTPTRPGYNFTGWYTTADGKPEDGKFDVDKTEITKDITLYAGWDKAPVYHPLTVTGGTATVEKDGQSLVIDPVVTGDKKTYSVPEGAEVTVTLDKTAVPNGKVFDGWSTSLPTGQDCKAETITFPMRSDVNVSAKYRDAATDHTPDTAVCHPLTVTGGIVTVKNGDKDVTNTLTVTTDETTGKKTYSVPDGATVTVTLDKTLIPEGMVFDIWSTGKFSLPLGQDYKAESITFTMNTMSSDADIAAQYRDATIEDDGPNVLGTAAIIGTAAVGGAVLGYQAYSLGAEFAGKLMALPYFPSNRSALAMMLWEDAGKPMPESELLYPDVEQEEQDMDLQHAARWAMENELIPDLNDEGTAPEEMKFFPANPVSKLDVLNAWQKAQELKNN